MIGSCFQVGDRVYILEDPDHDVFQGFTGVIEKVGVQCCAGEGVIVNLEHWGRVMASYDMLGRVS